MLTAYSPSHPGPTTLHDVLQRLPQAPIVQPEACGGASATEVLAAAEARFRRPAESFLRPGFQGAVLENLTREDPLAPATLDNDVPDQTSRKVLVRCRMDETVDRVRAEQLALRATHERLDQKAADLRKRLAELARRADAVAPEAGSSILDRKLADFDTESSSEFDRRNEEALREQKDAITAAKARRAVLEAEVAARREALPLEEREVAALEKEQISMVAPAAVVDSKSRADASREREKAAGVAGMTEDQLNTAVETEEASVQTNSGISNWYQAQVTNLEQVGGIPISHKIIMGKDGCEGVEGIEVMVDLGSAQIMEVTVSAINGYLSSVQLCPSQESGGAREGITPSELEELKRAADAFPAPENLRLLVREALSRVKCAALRVEHVRQMRRKYLVSYRAADREVIITMPVGIVARFRLHPDYPKVAGGAQVVSLTGVGGWSATETKELCFRANSLACATLMDTMDGLQAAVDAWN